MIRLFKRARRWAPQQFGPPPALTDAAIIRRPWQGALPQRTRRPRQGALLQEPAGPGKGRCCKNLQARARDAAARKSPSAKILAEFASQKQKLCKPVDADETGLRNNAALSRSAFMAVGALLRFE